MQAIRSARSLITRNARAYHKEVEHKIPTMDELPVPAGSWQQISDARNRKHNTILAMGILFAAGSILTAKFSGLIYLNFSPPKSID